MSTEHDYAAASVLLKRHKDEAIRAAVDLNEISANLWIDKLHEVYPHVPINLPDCCVHISPSLSPEGIHQLKDQLEKNNLAPYTIQAVKEPDRESPHFGQIVNIRIYCVATRPDVREDDKVVGSASGSEGERGQDSVSQPIEDIAVEPIQDSQPASGV